MSSPYTPSVATLALDSAVSGLSHASTILTNLQPHSAQIVVCIHQLDTYLVDAVKCLDFIKDFLKILQQMLKMMKLAQFIPDIGPLISKAAGMIEKTQVVQTLKTVVGDVEKIIDKAQKGVMEHLRSASNALAIKLTQASEDIPDWKNVLNTLSALYKLVDMVIYVFFGTTSDQIVKSALEGLMKTADNVKAAFVLFEDSLTPVTQFIHSTLEMFKNDVLAHLKDAFSTIIAQLSSIKPLIDTCQSVLQVVEAAFAPVLEGLKIIEWVCEHTIGFLIDELMEKLHINQMLKELVEKIEQAVGVTEMKKKLEDIFDAIMEPLAGQMKGLVEGTDLKSIAGSFKHTAELIKGFRKEPAWQLYSLIEQGLLKNPHSCKPGELCKFWDDDESEDHADEQIPVKMKLVKKDFTVLHPHVSVDSLRNTTPPNVPSSKKSLKKRSRAAGGNLSTLLEHRQTAMDNLVSSALGIDPIVSETHLPIVPSSVSSGPTMMLFAMDLSPSPQSLLPAPTVPPSSQPATYGVKMDYAIYNDVPVSVLLRTTHAAFRTSLASVETSQTAVVPIVPLARVRQGDIPVAASFLGADVQPSSTFATLSEVVDAAQSPSPDPAVATLKSDLTLLRTQLTTSLTSFDSLYGLSLKIEKDLSLLSPPTLAFVDHLLALLQGLGPILSAITGFMDLSNKYRTALLGIGEVIAKQWIDWVFDIVTRIENAIVGFGKEKDEVVKAAEGFKVFYEAYHRHLEAGLDLSGIIRSLSERMKGALESLSAIEHGVEALVSSSPPPVETEFRTRLQALQSSVHALQTTWSALPTLGSHIDQLSTNLTTLQSDITYFLSTILSISHRSTTLERKLIATDIVRLQCQRLTNLFEIFESVLSQLGVQPDPTQPSVHEVVMTVSHTLHGVTLVTGSSWLRDLFEQGLPDLVVGGLELFLKEYFQMQGLAQELGTVGEEIGKRAEGVKGRVERLRESIKLLEGVGKTDDIV